MIDRNPQGPAVMDGGVVTPDELVLQWSDPAAQWGIGVFETLAVRDRSPRHLHQHLERLSAAAERLGVALPAATELVRGVKAVAEGRAEAGAWVKIMVSRSGRWAVFGGPVAAGEEGSAVSAVILPWRRHRLDPTMGIKSVGYAPMVLGLEEARRRGADDGLWLNERGHVIGSCTGNVFVVRGRAVVTPSLADGARDGVVRALAITALRDFGLSVRQSKVRFAALRLADEIFLTSSIRGIRPVVRLDGRYVRKGLRGPVTRKLAERLAESGVSQGA